MKNRLCALLGASALVVAMAAPVMAAENGEKPMHHHHARMHHGMKGGMASHESSTDDLNAQSLNAARNGSAPAVPGASGVAGKPMSSGSSMSNGTMSNGMGNGAAQ